MKRRAVECLNELAGRFLSVIEAVITQPLTAEVFRTIVYVGEGMRFLGFTENLQGVQLRFSDQIEDRVAAINRLTRECVGTVTASLWNFPSQASLKGVERATLLAHTCSRLLVYEDAANRAALLAALKSGLKPSPGISQAVDKQVIRKCGDILSCHNNLLEADGKGAC
jgi:hypothetical protein